MHSTILTFAPLEMGLKKTTENVRELVKTTFDEVGIGDEHKERIIFTTDEGSNVNQLGGSFRLSCFCHIGSTLAKRATILYKKSKLGDDVKEKCIEVGRFLKLVENCISKLRLFILF